MAIKISSDPLEALEKRLNETQGGEWYIEENAEVWELYAENPLPEHMMAKLKEATDHPQLLASMRYLHPFKIIQIYKEKFAYWPSLADGAFLAGLKGEVRSLIAELRLARERIAELEAELASK